MGRPQVASQIKKLGPRPAARYRRAMRWQNRVVLAGMLALLVCVCQCKRPPPAAPAPRTVGNLLATLPAQAQGVLWAPNFDKGLTGLTGFASALLDPNAWAVVDSFKASTGVDMRTAQGWNTAGVDTTEGLALLAGGLAPPTVVVKTRDTVRLDKFINLYAETRAETDGHAIGDVHGTTVHSYRGLHWSHVGGYTWITVGRDGRVAMVRMLQHVRREEGVVAPDHPLTADGNFAHDMKQVRAAVWMGWRGAHVGIFGPWALGLELSNKGLSSQLFVGSDTHGLPGIDPPPTAGIDPLMRRFGEHDLMFFAGQHFDLEDIMPPPDAAPSPAKGRAALLDPTAVTTEATNPNKPATASPAVERAFTKLTGLNWHTDIAPDIRGITMGLGLAGAEALALNKLDLSATFDVADASRAAGWLARAAQTMAQQNIVFRPAVQTVGQTSFTVYRSEHTLGEGLVGQGNDMRLAMRFAVLGKTVVVAVGPNAFDDQVHALLGPAAVPHPLVAKQGQAPQLAHAQHFFAVRLGRIGDVPHQTGRRRSHTAHARYPHGTLGRPCLAAHRRRGRNVRPSARRGAH